MQKAKFYSFLLVLCLWVPTDVFSQLVVPLNSFYSNEVFRHKILNTQSDIFTGDRFLLIDSFYYKSHFFSSNNINVLPVFNATVGVNRGELPEYKTINGFLFEFKKKRFGMQLLPYFYLQHPDIFEDSACSYIPGFYTRYNKGGGNVYFSDVRWNLSYKVSPYMYFSAGKGKMFLGRGIRSFFLSDAGGSYYYFRGTLNVWHIHYVWQVSTGYDKDSIRYGVEKREPKYFAYHYLNWAAKKWLNVSLFETVIWSHYLDGRVRGIEISYLNPIIFYRPVEFDLGSRDNVIMGGGITLKPWHNLFLYSQFVLDEFRIKELRANRGWYGNKYAIQLGAKWYANRWFMLGEMNVARPFIYSHDTPIGNYGMENQPLAHPLSGNFEEGICVIRRYEKTFYMQIKASLLRQGLNTSEWNVGSDIYLSYDDRSNEYGNYMLNGKLYEQASIAFRLAYPMDCFFREWFGETGYSVSRIDNHFHKNQLWIKIGFVTNIF